MLPNLAESLIESVKRVPGKAKEKALNTLGGLFDMVKGSNSVREEIGKQINTAIKTPLEAGGSALTAGSQLIHRHPIEATKTTANSFIETTKNVAKMGLAPLSGTMTVARSGIKTGKKILGAPSNFAFSAYHSVQRTNEKLFSLSDKFKEWNKLKSATAAVEEESAPIGEAPVAEVAEKKVPALMQVPKAPSAPATESTPEEQPETETETDEKKTDMPMAA